jgi:hypothetical protein
MDEIHSFAYPVLVWLSVADTGQYPFPSNADSAELRKKKIESLEENLGYENRLWQVKSSPFESFLPESMAQTPLT